MTDTEPNRTLLSGARKACWMVFAVSAAVRMIGLTNLSSSAYWIPDRGDMQFYLHLADAWLSGTWPDGTAYYGLPGYAWFLGALFSVFGKDYFLVAAIQALADALTATIAFQLTVRAITPQHTRPGTIAYLSGAVAVVGYLFLQIAQALSAAIMPTCLAALAFWGLVWVATHWRSKSPALWMVMTAGTVAGLSATASGTAATVLGVLTVALLLPGIALWPRRLFLVAVLWVGALLGMLPCWGYNLWVAKDPVLLSAHGGINYFIGNHKGANGYPHVPKGLRAGQEQLLADSISVAEAAEGRPLRLGEVSAFWVGQARDYIESDPVGHRWLLLRKLSNFVNRFEYDDLAIIEIYRRERLLFPGFRFGDLVVLGIPGLLVGTILYPRSRMTGLAVVLLAAALLPMFVTERYRLVAAPGLAIGCGLSMAIWSRMFASRSWRPVAAWLPLAGALALWSTARRDPVIISGMIDYNYGIQALAANELPKARQLLDRAAEVGPNNPEIVFAQGNLALAEGDSVAARNLYRRTTELDPEHGRAFNNLGVIAEGEGRHDLARRFLERAVELKPTDGESRYVLSRALLHLGEFDAARKQFNLAAEILGDRPQIRALREELDAAQSVASPPPQ